MRSPLRTRGGAAAAAGTALALATLLLPPGQAAAQPAPQPVRAASADTFLSSLGVNTHVDQGYDPESYIAPLQYLGIREVRDGERHVDGDIAIARATGVRFAINAGGDLDGLLASARILAKAGALLAVEGPNEVNNFPINYGGLQGGGPGHSWYAVAAFQAALYAAVKHDPVLARYPVFGPSETGAETDNVGVQFCVVPADAGTIFPPGTHFADYLNVHNYVSGVHGGYGDNQAWNAADPLLNGRWDGLYGNNGLTWFRHFQGYEPKALVATPRVTTETGWDSVADPGGEAVQASVLTNTYLAQFKRGWRYTFIYELRDGEGGVGHQGFYRGDAPKQVAVAIHNLTTILADRRPIPSPRSLSYVIENRTPTVHDLLLEKSSGEFDLVIWDERVSGTDHVTVKFATPQPVIKVFDIKQGSTPLRELARAEKVDLSLTDHAMILGLPR